MTIGDAIAKVVGTIVGTLLRFFWTLVPLTIMVALTFIISFGFRIEMDVAAIIVGSLGIVISLERILSEIKEKFST